MGHMVLKLALREKMACRTVKARPTGVMSVSQVGAFRSDAVLVHH